MTVDRVLSWTLDAATFAVDAGVPEPDETQCRVLRDPGQFVSVVASRQWGKSTIVSRIALRTAVLVPESLTLVGSITERQSVEMLRKVRDGWLALSACGVAPAVKRESLTMIELANGARVVSLPGDEKAFRSWTAPDLVVLDESARIPDDVYHASRPLLTGGGRMYLISSAFAEQGFHYELASRCDPEWSHYTIPASACPRFSPEWLAAERLALGPRRFAREYECEWGAVSAQLLSHALIRSMYDDDVAPLFAALAVA